MSTPTPGVPQLPQQPPADPFEDYRKKPSPQGLRGVVDTLQPTIEKALRAYAPSATAVVRGRARGIAADAVRSFRPNQGADLNTHVYRQLQRLQREGPKISDPMPAPERTRRDSGKIMAAISSAADDIGREPTDEEIAELTGLPRRRVTKIRKGLRHRISESQYTEGFGGDEGDDTTVDAVASERTGYDDWVDAVYHDLPEVDRVILQYRTGFRGAPKLSNTDIAQRLKISPAAVSQRVTRIQAKLDEYHD
jgi:DNA-directed RNA polymerase specialized sigma subunit